VGGRCEGVDVNARAGLTLARSIGEAAVACSEGAVGFGCAEDPRPHRGPGRQVDAADIGSAAL
jgi:hypothetical protein